MKLHTRMYNNRNAKVHGDFLVEAVIGISYLPPYSSSSDMYTTRENNASILHKSVAKNTEAGCSRNRVIPNSDEVLECIILDRAAGKISRI